MYSRGILARLQVRQKKLGRVYRRMMVVIVKDGKLVEEERQVPALLNAVASKRVCKRGEKW
jgi:hypothetical protein